MNLPEVIDIEDIRSLSQREREDALVKIVSTVAKLFLEPDNSQFIGFIVNAKGEHVNARAFGYGCPACNYERVMYFILKALLDKEVPEHTDKVESGEIVLPPNSTVN